QTIIHGATLYDARTGKEQGALTGYAGGGLAFSRDSKALVSVLGEKAMRWDVATAVKRDVPGKATVSKDGKTVAFEKEAPIKLHTPLPLSLYPSEQEISDTVAPRLFALRRGDPQVPPPGSDPIKMVVSPDGKLRVELVHPYDKDRLGYLNVPRG